MGKKVITFGLSAREINRAIKELEQYKQEIIRKTDLLREKVADRLAELVKSGFAGAVVDDLLRGGQRTAQVDVTIEDRENVTLVIASGEDAIWAEFGAGVHHNGSPGSSPHPKGSELGFTIGSYGKGMGKKDIWGFYEDGELRLTHGAPATMPMYNALKTVCDEISEIAREVFR
ncbi:hypothetical protein [Anaerotruncus sp. DFI.9.16]|uniref:hypothetical protein n=1 Tax=Anaerotruncus sp. DFI.9.16 TaxID=2965275 RepID=UPI00210E09FD|nr:hypothetical protein [Anaerotruncus sp. DFI.9.16]MCQ4894916.1 hypothetical protein [Anaerotruncus sp. DFI.9.16]